MNIIEVATKQQQKQYLAFRKEIMKTTPQFIDNDVYLIKELFAKKTSFNKNKEVKVLMVEDAGQILCQGMVVYASQLPEYIQLCFFVGRENVMDAATMLVNTAMEIGKKHLCERLVIGLNGHVNYGLGLLASHYSERNSFASSYNPAYYNDYFRQMQCEEVVLNTYQIGSIDHRLERYDAFFRKIDRSYTFKTFDRGEFQKYSEIYTDLNNKCFNHHKYYYPRSYVEDSEMLKELFMFMKEDSLIFAFDGEKPVAFLMWYPDFNELAKPGEAFGARHYFRNLLHNRDIHTAKVMEYGVLEEYRKVGLPLALIHQVFLAIQNRKITKVESSWIMEENADSKSFCEGICDGEYKKFVVYEKEIR